MTPISCSSRVSRQAKNGQRITRHEESAEGGEGMVGSGRLMWVIGGGQSWTDVSGPMSLCVPGASRRSRWQAPLCWAKLRRIVSPNCPWSCTAHCGRRTVRRCVPLHFSVSCLAYSTRDAMLCVLKRRCFAGPVGSPSLVAAARHTRRVLSGQV